MGEKTEQRQDEQLKRPEAEKVESREDRIKKIIHLFEVGAGAGDCIGYHGTSLEAIEFLIENGYLPGGAPDEVGHKSGHIFFYPKKSQFSEHPLLEEFRKEDNLMQECAGYAEMNAQAHFLLKSLGLDISNGELVVKAVDIFITRGSDDYDYFIKLGVNKKKLNNEIRVAKNRKGIVLSLSKDILKSHTVLPGDKGEGDLKVSVPEGLSLNFISGLEPMGQEEWDFFEKLREQ